MFIEKLLKKYKQLIHTPEIKRLKKLSRYTVGCTNILGKPFKFHDNASFLVTYNELFVQEIYKFKPTLNNRYIIDCGANIGLSVIYFALNYPKHTIIAFEPQQDLFLILEENVKHFGLKNVQLHNKAVWDKYEQLEFFTDGGMGGRINDAYSGQVPVKVNAVPLMDYLDKEIDFLKIDIEGAEDAVLRSCIGNLNKANNIFFEYHNKINQSQTLDELLLIMKNEGFTYYIKESAPRDRPFVNSIRICETFDMALNIFCYKQRASN